MTSKVAPRMISAKTNGMLTFEVAAWTITSPTRADDRVPWKKRESRSRSRKAVPVSQTAMDKTTAR